MLQVSGDSLLLVLLTYVPNIFGLFGGLYVSGLVGSMTQLKGLTEGCNVVSGIREMMAINGY